MSSSANKILAFRGRQEDPQSPLAEKPAERIKTESATQVPRATPAVDAPPSPGTSSGAVDFQEAFAELRTHLGTAQRLAESLEMPRESRTRALQIRASRRAALEAAWGEFSIRGWDGYGAEPVSSEAYAMAKALLETLPVDAPTPEISADPDGEISFDWYRGPDKVFSVSVGGSGMLSYAGLFGRNNAHGTEWYDGGLPEVVAFNLARLHRNK